MHTNALHALCTCNSAVILRAGAPCCASCGAPIVAKGETSSEYSSRNLPADVRVASTLNRACAAGLVAGAEKRGRIWVCAREAWHAYRRTRPTRARASRSEVVPRDPDAELLAELGATRRGGMSA